MTPQQLNCQVICGLCVRFRVCGAQKWHPASCIGPKASDLDAEGYKDGPMHAVICAPDLVDEDMPGILSTKTAHLCHLCLTDVMCPHEWCRFASISRINIGYLKPPISLAVIG